jgi:hypothetical protein
VVVNFIGKKMIQCYDLSIVLSAGWSKASMKIEFVNCAPEEQVSFVPLAIGIPISGWRFPFLLGYLLTDIISIISRRRNNNVFVRV